MYQCPELSSCCGDSAWPEEASTLGCYGYSVAFWEPFCHSWTQAPDLHGQDAPLLLRRPDAEGRPDRVHHPHQGRPGERGRRLPLPSRRHHVHHAGTPDQVKCCSSWIVSHYYIATTKILTENVYCLGANGVCEVPIRFHRDFRRSHFVYKPHVENDGAGYLSKNNRNLVNAVGA